MENWRELLKDKPVKYWIRAEIEEIIKEKSIDRKRFYEYSKTNYQKIINRFYYTFVDYKKYPKVELSYCWLHFRQELKEIDCWRIFILLLRNLINLQHIRMTVSAYVFMKNSNSYKTVDIFYLHKK